ncbi:MAG: AMP-binding protein, partial [Actinobacteria bacterium]|nr:AMP-binding protein [Actinomycetota bacterium]
MTQLPSLPKLPSYNEVRQRLDDLGFGFGLANQVGFFSIDGARLLPALIGAARRWGAGPALGFEATANAFGDAVGLYDDAGALTFNELRDRSDALAVALGEHGVDAGSKVGLLARNHRGLVLSTVALNKLGADAVFLNTGFAGPQVVDVSKREGVAVMIADQEFDGIVKGVDATVFHSWTDTASDTKTINDLIDGGIGRRPNKPDRESRTVILTSGTTGTPKGASRDTTDSASSALGFIARVPLKIRDTTLVAAPGFHAWGAAHLAAGLLLGSTVILQRKFDPEAVLAAIDMHRVRTLAVVPVMLQRILDLSEDVRSRYNTSSLEVVASSGSALPGPLANRWMDAFGDNLYNTYGSTEVSVVSVADPQQLRATPGTAGTPLRGNTIRLVDERGNDVEPGDTGRIFVGNTALFDGYTGGGNKEMLGGLMSSGDVGHFDDNGNLLVDGRDDDMIVSGGENVFPQEVEDLIAGMNGVEEVAVVGVPDDEFG